MSSHHIIREKQEPALLIISMNEFDEEYLGQLLEWSPMIMVYDQQVDKILSLGIKIDTILTPESETKPLQEHLKIVPCGDDVLEAALKYLVAEGYPAVNIITNHFQAKEYLLFVYLLDIVVFDQHRKIYPIKSGFSKWKAKGEDIYVLHPEIIHQLSHAGLKKIDQEHFQTLKDGFFSFTFEPPFIFVAEQL